MGEAKNRGTFEQRRKEAIMQGRGQPQVQLTEKDTIEIKCKPCGGELFDMAYRLRTFPALSPKNPTGKDQLVKIETHICRGCGHEFGKSFFQDGKADE